MAVGNVAFGLNLFTLAIDILTWLINMSALIVLVQHVYTKRLRCKKKVIFWIYMYIHLTLLVLMSSLMFFHVETYLGDGYNNNIQSVACTFVGFMLYIALNMFILSLVNQALYRLCRIVYSTRRFLLSLRFYMILPLVYFISSATLLSPLLFTNSIIYFPTQNNCFIKSTNVFAIFWAGSVIYLIPIAIIAFLYWKIISFIRHQLTNQTITIQQRQKRELPVIRRLFIVIAITTVSELPAFIYTFVMLCTRMESDVDYRLMWLLISSGLLGSSIFIILLTPEIKTILVNNRVAFL